MNTVKLSSGLVALMTIIFLSDCTMPVVPAAQWRHQPVTSDDTVFPGIKLGMTEEQVRAKISPRYKIIDDQQAILRQTPGLSSLADTTGRRMTFLRVDHLHEQDRVIEIDHFVFIDNHLTNAFGGCSSPLR